MMSCVPPENMPPYEEDDGEEEEDGVPTEPLSPGSTTGYGLIYQAETTSSSELVQPNRYFWEVQPPVAPPTISTDMMVEIYGGAQVGIDTVTGTLAIMFQAKDGKAPPAVLYKEKEATLFLSQLRNTLIYLSQMPVPPPPIGAD